MKTTFKEEVAKLRAYAKATRGPQAQLTEKQIKSLYKAYKSGALNENTAAGRSRAVLNDLGILTENFKTYKLQTRGTATVTVEEAKRLKEACAKANARGIILKEAQEPLTTEMGAVQGQPAATAPVAGAPMDPTATDPAAQTPMSNEELQATVQSLLSQVQQLATQLGVQTNEFGGDPSASVPAETGMDPMAQPQPGEAQEPQLAEACKAWRVNHNGAIIDEATFRSLKSEIDGRNGHVTTIKEKVALRKAGNSVLQSKLNESGAQDFAKEYFNFIAQTGTMPHVTTGGSGDAKANVAPVSVGEMAKGVIKGEPGKVKAKINWNGIKDEVKKQPQFKTQASKVTEAYIAAAKEEKLDWDKLNEQYQGGLLG